jgi:8-oxo-dGTP diphosphatase
LRLVQLRAHQLPDADYLVLAEAAWDLCQKHGARLLLNRPQQPEKWAGRSDGIHLTRHQLMSLDHRLEGHAWMGASCHDPVELHRAQQLGLDYVLLSPVQITRSHPDAEPMGWKRFAEWVNAVNLPVYALGGLESKHLPLAKRMGAQGIAGISGFWTGQTPNP